MGEYDAVWVFLISLVFVGFYIYIEARPKGSNLFESISKTIEALVSDRLANPKKQGVLNGYKKIG